MSRIVWILAVLLSHWRRHPMQLATLLIGLISATALWSGVQALNQQARTSYDRAAAIFGGTKPAMLVSRNGLPFSQRLFVDLRRAGWPVSPVLEGRVQIGGRSYRLLGIDPLTMPAEVGNAPSVERENLQSFMTPPGEALVAPEVLAELGLKEGATPLSGDGTLLPPLRLQAQLVPGVLVVDIGIAQQLLKMPDQVSRLLIGKAKGKRAPLEAVAGETVHRQFRDRACVRAAAADAAYLARLRGIGTDAERGALGRTGLAGAGRRHRWTGVRLPDRGVAIA
jgi:putative ABC transport system permease protein